MDGENLRLNDTSTSFATQVVVGLVFHHWVSEIGKVELTQCSLIDVSVTGPGTPLAVFVDIEARNGTIEISLRAITVECDSGRRRLRLHHDLCG